MINAGDRQGGRDPASDYLIEVTYVHNVDSVISGANLQLSSLKFQNET
jgi:hypothetical protein